MNSINDDNKIALKNGGYLDAVHAAAALLEQTKRVHCIGIGGIGMSAVAGVFHAGGYLVSGSDITENSQTLALRAQGITVSIGHDATHIPKDGLVIYSNAIDADNVERRAARAAGLPEISRAVALAVISRRFRTIAVAGTHGKTTTAGLISAMLHDNGIDATFLIGGLANNSGVNNALGGSEWCVIEADESDHAFLHLQADIAVITNVDNDHLSVYGGEQNALTDAFWRFANQTTADGCVIICGDDHGARSVANRQPHPHIIRYGCGKDCALRATDTQYDSNGIQLCVDNQQFTVPLFGAHNVLNSLAAIGVGQHIGLANTAIAASLARFSGMRRRFQLLGTVTIASKRITIVDDYAHHPTEIAATLRAARQRFGKQRIVALMQPHRYTRLRDHWQDFVTILQPTPTGADKVIIMPVYAASETSLDGIDQHALAKATGAIALAGTTADITVDTLATALGTQCRDGDIIIGLGAGNIHTLLTTLQQQYG